MHNVLQESQPKAVWSRVDTVTTMFPNFGAMVPSSSCISRTISDSVSQTERDVSTKPIRTAEAKQKSTCYVITMLFGFIYCSTSGYTEVLCIRTIIIDNNNFCLVGIQNHSWALDNVGSHGGNKLFHRLNTMIINNWNSKSKTTVVRIECTQL